MKSIILNDTHFGYKADSSIVLDYFLSFFKNQLFPYIEKNKITTLFHLGDLFDRRKYINFKTLNRVRNEFLNPLQEMNVKCHIICGNHDTFFRNTNKLNSLDELVSNYSNWSVYSEPTEINLKDGCVALLPWINPENEEESAKFWSVYNQKHIDLKANSRYYKNQKVDKKLSEMSEDECKKMMELKFAKDTKELEIDKITYLLSLRTCLQESVLDSKIYSKLKYPTITIKAESLI
jgi:DNA repair exonuclease SbcCD nuclease subunit